MIYWWQQNPWKICTAILLNSIVLRMASFEYITIYIQKNDSQEGLFVMFFLLFPFAGVCLSIRVVYHPPTTIATDNAHRSPFSLYYCLLSSSPPFYILAWLGVVLKECRSYEKRQSNIRPREKNEILQGHFCQFEHD